VITAILMPSGRSSAIVRPRLTSRVGSPFNERAHRLRGVDHLFEVVQDQEQMLGFEVGSEALHDRPVGDLAHPPGTGNGGWQESRICEWGQIHKHHAVIEAVRQLPADLYSEACLPNPRRADDGYQADVIVEDETPQGGDFSLTTK